MILLANIYSLECLKCKVPDLDGSVSINTVIQQLQIVVTALSIIVCVNEICRQLHPIYKNIEVLMYLPRILKIGS